MGRNVRDWREYGEGCERVWGRWRTKRDGCGVYDLWVGLLEAEGHVGKIR